MHQAPTFNTGVDTPVSHTLYVLVRTDLSVEQQAVQAAHAAAEAGRQYYRAEHGIARLVMLGVPGPFALQQAQRRLTLAGLEFVTFYEPDNDVGESAVAVRPLADHERGPLRRWELWRAPPAAASACERSS